MRVVIFPCGHSTPDNCERCDLALIRRRGFLRGLVGVAAAVIVAPVIVQVPVSLPPMPGKIMVNGQVWAFKATYEGAFYAVTAEYVMAT